MLQKFTIKYPETGELDIQEVEVQPGEDPTGAIVREGDPISEFELVGEV